MSNQESHWVEGRPIIPGTIAWYDYSQQIRARGEPNKVRPTVILSCDGELLGVPFSKQPPRRASDILVSEGKWTALTSFVSVLDPKNILNYVGDLDPQDLKELKSTVGKYFAPLDDEMPRQRLKPGDVYRFKDREGPAERLMMIVGNMYSHNIAEPLQTLPIAWTPGEELKEFGAAIEPMPRECFARNARVGNVGPEALAHVRAAIGQRFTLPADAGMAHE